MLSCTTCLILFVIGLIFKFFSFLTKEEGKQFPPGPYPLPFIGNVLSLSAGPHIKFADWAKTFGNIFQVYIGPYRMYVLSDVKLIRKAFTDLTLSGRIGLETFTLFTGGPYGVANSQGQEWLEQRRFTLRHLRNLGFGKSAMEKLILEEVNEFVTNLKCNQGQPIILNRKFDVAVLNSLWRIVAGKRYKQDDPRLWNIFQQYQKAAKLLESSPAILFPSLAKLFPSWSGWTQLKSIFGNQRDVFLETINEHAKIMEENNKNGGRSAEDSEPTDFIYAYLQEIKKTDDQRSSFYKDVGIKSLIGVIADLFNAGSDTTSLTLSWAVLYLCKYQNVQKKFHEELDTVVGKHRKPSLADRFNTPYTEAIMLEVFRKSSIVPIGLFHTALHSTNLYGFEVPEDTWLCANLHYVHHDPNIWEKPYEFIPERFLNAKGQTGKRPEALLPFSIGKRACPAETLVKDQVFLFLTSIFQRFHIRLDEQSQDVDINSPELSFLLAPPTFSVLTRDRLQSYD